MEISVLSFLRTRLFLLIHEKLYCKETNPNVESIFFFFIPYSTFLFFLFLALSWKKNMEDDQNTQRDEIMVLMGSL